MICYPCGREADWQAEGMPPPYIFGHKDCKDCDCQHKPVKEGQIVGQAQQD